MPTTPVDVVTLFREERSALLDLLAGLNDADWRRSTTCPGWTVHDIALHLLLDDLRYLSRQRDRFSPPSATGASEPAGREEVTDLVNHLNHAWLEGARWMSPPLLLSLLDFTGEQFTAHIAAVDPDALGAPVEWAGPDPAPVRLDIAREYTERWVHQQQIREAVGRPGLTGRRHYFPVLDAFAQALPYALRDVAAPTGSIVQLIVQGQAGGVWTAIKDDAGWRLSDAIAPDGFAAVILDQDDAWKLFTKGISRDEALTRGQAAGDQPACEAILAMVTILA